MLETDATICLDAEQDGSGTCDPVMRHLGAHTFQELFIEVLGWDLVCGTLNVEVSERIFHFNRFAHKRGFQILHCPVDRHTIINRGLLRRLQRELAKSVHEHIVIYSSDEPQKQVWQWAVRFSDGRRLRHREHLFFSRLPPPALVDRLKGLLFTLDEEDDVTLHHALERAREALDTKADLDLFVRRPQYAEASDRLARAMVNGGFEEFHQFVTYHRPLAQWHAKRFHRAYGIDVDDAEQTAMLGIMRAAETFDPSRGYQFSTYASRWIIQVCRRTISPSTLTMRVPEYLFWPCMKVRSHMARLASHGPEQPREYLARVKARDRKIAKRWKYFERAGSVRSLSDRTTPEYQQAREIAGATEEPLARFVHEDSIVELRAAMQKLKPDDARLIRMRYGFDGEAMTLEAIGQVIGRTRERVRQRVCEIEEQLRRLLGMAD